MKALIIDNIHTIIVEKLTKAGVICDYKSNITKEEISESISKYQILIIRSKLKINQTLIDKGNQLKIIGRVGSGLENIDVEYAKSKGIICFNSPEGNRDSVGEQAVCMLLSLITKLNIANQQVKSGIWDRNSNWGIELKGKTVGIIGYGNMGSTFAKKLQGFEANIIAYDKYKSGFANEYVKAVTLEEIFKQTDFLSIHVPLTDETKYMVNDSFINKFEKNIYILNTARGKALKTEDLVKNIESGKVLGAALDVIEYEDVSFEKFGCTNQQAPFEYLKKSDKVILSPHVAGWTFESNFKIADVLADKIVGFLGR
jgi:D-3-phosphoglycerate dehydrogenase